MRLAIIITALALGTATGTVSAQTAAAPQQNDNAAKFVDQTLISGPTFNVLGPPFSFSSTKYCSTTVGWAVNGATKRMTIDWRRVSLAIADSIYKSRVEIRGAGFNLIYIDAGDQTLRDRLVKAMDDLRKSCAPPSYGY